MRTLPLVAAASAVVALAAWSARSACQPGSIGARAVREAEPAMTSSSLLAPAPAPSARLALAEVSPVPALDAPLPEPAVAPAESHAVCLRELTLAGLLLDPAAGDGAFERELARLSRAERVVLRHRIRRVFSVGHADPDTLRSLGLSEPVLAVLRRQLAWLAKQLDEAPVDSFAALRVAPAAPLAEDDAALARRYAGACDEELAVELDALEQARRAENERGLDERVALGLHRVRHQPAEF